MSPPPVKFRICWLRYHGGRICRVGRHSVLSQSQRAADWAKKRRDVRRYWWSPTFASFLCPAWYWANHGSAFIGTYSPNLHTSFYGTLQTWYSLPWYCSNHGAYIVLLQSWFCIPWSSNHRSAFHGTALITVLPRIQCTNHGSAFHGTAPIMVMPSMAMHQSLYFFLPWYCAYHGTSFYLTAQIMVLPSMVLL